MDFRDIASVQILRGPQGTLFGRNTIGGAVLLTTNAPGDDAGNSVRVGVGEDNLREALRRVRHSAGRPPCPRASPLGGRERDGYVTRAFDGEDLGDEEMYTGQLGIRWKPSDAFYAHAARRLHQGRRERLAVRVPVDERGGDLRRRRQPGRGLPEHARSAAAAGAGGAAGRSALRQRCAGAWGRSRTAARTRRPARSRTAACRWWRNGTSTTRCPSSRSPPIAAWSGPARATPTTRRCSSCTPTTTARATSSARSCRPWSSTSRVDGVVGLYYFDEDSFDRLLVPLGNPGTSYDTQRVSMDCHGQGGVHRVDLQDHRCASASAPALRYTEETKGLQATMFNVAPATRAEPAAPTALCPFAGPPPTQTGCLFLTTNRFEREFSATTTSASAQYRFNPQLMTYAELVRRLQERWLQPALQRRAAGQRADLLRPREPPSRRKWVRRWIRRTRCA